MQKWTIRLLAISILAASACASKSAAVRNWGNETAVNLYFSDKSKDYAYRTKIAVYGNELNGILIAKKISDSVHRVVLATDFGNTLLDFEVGETTFIKNNIVEDLDRKIIVNTLRDDFRLLFREKYGNARFSDEANSTKEIVEGKTLYRLSYSANKLISISKGNAKKEKVSVGFTPENNTFAEKIEIEHRDIKLRIEMNALTP